MKSKTLIDKQLRKKKNQELVETILASKKNDKWVEISGMISGPRRNRIDVNLTDLNKESKDGDKMLVPGKVLSQGEIDKKIKVVALGFSERAREKLLKKGCEVKSILEEIKSNPSAEGIKILN